ncbi:hypothetical protein AB395_0000116 [Sinorhizobium fredii CCBAU 45436]|nr:hypothetical protein SF83666_c01170 [Sinorhizobium fredii CCBAU 83666]AWI55802.1 hypothetical protein AB395_0000116 [Sinorhizobium fredii CCBAU 45436]AWM23402.1 hypothetical protein AOX55_0000117 [Sinorhizobium fredii CCBAU 25509]
MCGCIWLAHGDSSRKPHSRDCIAARCAARRSSSGFRNFSRSRQVRTILIQIATVIGSEKPERDARGSASQLLFIPL